MVSLKATLVSLHHVMSTIFLKLCLYILPAGQGKNVDPMHIVLFFDIVLFCFCFICHFYPPFTRKRIVSLYFGRDVRTRLGVAFFEVYAPPVFHIKAGASR